MIDYSYSGHYITTLLHYCFLLLTVIFPMIPRLACLMIIILHHVRRHTYPWKDLSSEYLFYLSFLSLHTEVTLQSVQNEQQPNVSLILLSLFESSE